MKRLVSIQAALVLTAAPALAQNLGPPPPTGALPSVTNPGAAPSGPAITIDPRGLTGGVTGDILPGTAAVVIDAAPVTTSDAVVVSRTGVDAAATSTTLNPAPPTAPLCRERRQPGCRNR